MESQSEVIDIAMVSWNRPNFTYWAIKALKDNTLHPYRLILIDNGSTPQMQSMLAALKCECYIDTLILLDKNYGLEWAKNKVMDYVESPLFVSTDNDILAYKYDPCWLDRLVNLMDAYPEYAAIGCRPQILVGTGNIFHEKTDPIIEFSHVPGYHRIMRTDLVRQAGAWNDKRPSRGHEELWISERLRNMGYKVGWANHVKCWHLFGEDNWGYEKTLKPEEHGHNPVASLPKDDQIEIMASTGIDISKDIWNIENGKMY